MSFESKFASMSPNDFVKHLESYGIIPTAQEREAKPASKSFSMESGITLSILDMTGQRFGDAVVGESSAK